MKELIYNNDNLFDSEINETVIRMKVLLIRNNNMILGYERGIYQFPGGHLEENESFNDCIKREIMEETGIKILDKDIGEPIYKIVSLNRNHPDIGRNRRSEIYYYVINTNKDIDLSKTNYTKDELEGDFKVKEIPLNRGIDELQDNINNNEKNKVITPDMIRVIREYMRLSNK